MELIIRSIGHVLLTATGMFWEVLWPLALGFILSAVIQALVSHRSMAKVLGCDKARCYAFATLFGAVSSSCSYAAVALARSVFRKGASFISSMIFEIASTNLVIELGLALIVLLGWQFMAAEVIGGVLMIILLIVIFRLTLKPKLVQSAKEQAEKGLIGRMEGHAAMDMSVEGNSFFSRLFSSRGLTSVSHYYVMDWLSVWIDVAIGFLIAGILAVFVPNSFWQSLFLINHPVWSVVIGPLIGPIIAIISFVCSVGNIALAAVLWQGGISFGGVASFIFADLIVLPILDIYRRYYGTKMMLYILGTFYAAMAAAGYLVEIIFYIFNMIPTNRQLSVLVAGFSWNYATILNLIFLAASAILIIIFLKTGGRMMLKMMKMPVHHSK